MAGLIRVLRRALTKDIVRSKSGKAYRYIVITAFSVRAVMVYLLTLAPVSIIDRFQLL